MIRRSCRALAILVLIILLGPGERAASAGPASAAPAAPAGPAGAAGAPARVPATPPGGHARVFRWPLAGTPVVTRPFQPPPRPWLAGHRGVDLAGTVAGVGVVSIDHANRLRTTYEPVAASVHSGQPVSVGQPIGTLARGHPGCPGLACLHWGLRRGAEYLDPLLLLGAGRVRLLPLTAAVSAAHRRAARTPPAGCRPGRTGAAAAGRARRTRRPRRATRRRSVRGAGSPPPCLPPPAAGRDASAAGRPGRADRCSRGPRRPPAGRSARAPRCAPVPAPRRGCAARTPRSARPARRCSPACRPPPRSAESRRRRPS